jgi:phenylacetate-coenzyme A ligase PaaK-like adenylate-forming protein
MSGYWDPHIERMPLEDLHVLQEDRLKSTVRYVYDHSAFYRRRFKEAGVEPGDIKTLADITKLPFTRKVDLRDNYPTRMFSAPKSQVVRYHVSSGTTGKPTVVGYTKGDIKSFREEHMAEIVQMLERSKITEDGAVQIIPSGQEGRLSPENRPGQCVRLWPRARRLSRTTKQAARGP